MSEIPQEISFSINVTAKTSHIARLTAEKIISHIHNSFPQAHQKFAHFELKSSFFQDTNVGVNCWIISFSSSHYINCDTSTGIPQAPTKALKVQDVRDYLIDFVCQFNVHPSVQLSFSRRLVTVHFEKLIAHHI